ncbi:MAG TPA: beta-1,6-N-acetylglucosaminyltransferase [Gammaproteobacteria bacterium]|nr:beta-1,6-N-acetylglucosaminyltransferase [Gammaproteobacteria bacterium]
MRALYLVFSHDHQEQLARLVRAVRRLSPGSLIAVHHDPQKEPLGSGLLEGVGNVHVIPDPVAGQWGDFSLVEQYLHSFRWCLQNLDFDWVVTLTGLSYPVMHLEKFEASLQESGFDAFVYHFDAFDPGHWPKGTGVTRYLFAYFRLPRNPYYYKVPARLKTALSRLRRAFNEGQPWFRIVPMPRGARTRLGVRRLSMPFNRDFVICGGRQMLNMSRPALERVFSYLDEHPRYIAYAKRTLIPDESFFTSIVANDPGIRVCNEVRRYIKWPSATSHAASGAVISRDEVDDILKSGQPFALKFDSRVDALALDKVDAFLGLPPEA